MSALGGQSDRTLSLCWEQHCKLLPGVQGIHASQVAAWNVEEVSEHHCLLSYLFVYCFYFLTVSIHFHSTLQVSSFVQNLIGCEEQARVFKDEVRPPSAC